MLLPLLRVGLTLLRWPGMLAGLELLCYFGTICLGIAASWLYGTAEAWQGSDLMCYEFLSAHHPALYF